MESTEPEQPGRESLEGVSRGAVAVVSEAHSEQPGTLKSDREASLLLKWSRGGRLLPIEFEEIRHRLPAEAIERLDRLFSNEDGLRTEGFARYEKRIADYETVFGVKARQLKEYIKIGKAARDPVTGRPKTDLPPFDRPSEMLAWWHRNMKQRPPANILNLAAARRLGADPSESEPSVNIADYEGQISDALREAQTMLSVATAQLKDAYKSGVDSRIEIKHRRWLKALRAVKEAEMAAREQQKAAGELIPAAEILPALSELLQVLKHMRSTRRRRTLDRLEDLSLPPDLLDRFGTAVDDAREDEDRVLRQLKQFRSTEEIDEFMLGGNGAFTAAPR